MKRFAILTAILLAVAATMLIGADYRRGGRDTGLVYYVVASDAPGTFKRGGPNTWLCDGTNDEVQIQAAIDRAWDPNGSGTHTTGEGGTVMLSPGSFSVTKPSGATDIVFTADLVNADPTAGHAKLNNLVFSVGAEGNLAAGMLFRCSGGGDTGGDSLEDNKSDIITTLVVLGASADGYVVDNQFVEDYNTDGDTGTKPTFARVIGAIELRQSVWVKGAGIHATTVKLADASNCTMFVEEAALDGDRTIGTGISHVYLNGNRSNQGDDSTATYHPLCNGIVLNDNTWDAHFENIAMEGFKGDGIWVCQPWGFHIYGGGWVEFNSGSGIVFGDGNVGTIEGTKIADVGDATNRDAHASNTTPGDGAVFTVAGIRLRYSTDCVIRPSLVECNQHWGIYDRIGSRNIYTGIIIQSTNAGAAGEGGMWIVGCTKNVITGNVFTLSQAGTGLKMGGFDNVVTGNWFDDSTGTTIDFSGGAGMNAVAGNINAAPDAQTVADNGNGKASLTLAPRSPYVELTCNDADDCDVTMSEANIQEGVVVTIVNVGANTFDFADSAGVLELAGGAAFAMAQYDVLRIVYLGDRWVELGRANN